MINFNPKEHAESMKEQASEILPNDLSLEDKKYVTDIEYIFEKICEVAQRTNEPNVIVEELKKVLIKN